MKLCCKSVLVLKLSVLKRPGKRLSFHPCKVDQKSIYTHIDLLYWKNWQKADITFSVKIEGRQFGKFDPYNHVEILTSSSGSILPGTNALAPPSLIKVLYYFKSQIIVFELFVDVMYC